MSARAADLPERDKDVLRRILRGYDAKTIARELDVSVHVVNERLRNARRTLGVTSSREAARLLEAEDPKSLGPEPFGIEPPPKIDPDHGLSERRTPDERSPIPLVELTMIAIALGALALAASTHREALPSRPRVTSTQPGVGSAVPPGPLVLRVTFDRPMRAGGYSFVRIDPRTYPGCAARPALSRDRRSVTLHCTLEPDRAYEVWFNREPYMNFKSSDGVSAEPFQLRFRTTSGTLTPSRGR